jgi:hypothetical protein
MTNALKGRRKDKHNTPAPINIPKYSSSQIINLRVQVSTGDQSSNSQVSSAQSQMSTVDNASSFNPRVNFFEDSTEMDEATWGLLYIIP